MNSKLELDKLNQLCESLEDLSYEIYENLEDDLKDETISELAERQLLGQFGHLSDEPLVVTQENWDSYDQNPAGERGPNLVELLGKGASYTAAGIKKAAQLSWKGFTKFATEVSVQLDHTGDQDLKRTEEALGKAEGDGHGKFLNRSLAQKLARDGQVPEDFPQWFDEATRASKNLIEKLVPVTNNVLNDANHAIEQYVPGNGQSVKTMASKLENALKRVKPIEEIVGRAFLNTQWPGGFGLMLQLKPVELKQKSPLANFMETKVNDINLQKKNMARSVSGFLPVLPRYECEELLKTIARFINANQSLAKTVERTNSRIDTRLSGTHLGNRLRFIIAREKLRGGEDAVDQATLDSLWLSAKMLKRYTYLTPRTVVRRLLNRNLAMIRDSLQYIRESVKQY